MWPMRCGPAESFLLVLISINHELCTAWIMALPVVLNIFSYPLSTDFCISRFSYVLLMGGCKCTPCTFCCVQQWILCNSAKNVINVPMAFGLLGTRCHSMKTSSAARSTRTVLICAVWDPSYCQLLGGLWFLLSQSLARQDHQGALTRSACVTDFVYPTIVHWWLVRHSFSTTTSTSTSDLHTCMSMAYWLI